MESNERTIKVSHIEKNTTLLGPYNRFVIWVHGCCFQCEGCLAENMKNGPYYTMEISSLVEEIASTNVEGITISGGEPFLQSPQLGALVSQLKRRKDIGVIVYSGFTLEELLEKQDAEQLLAETDILIDGQYVKSLDDGRAYVGSSNQRIHYLSTRYQKAGPIYYSTPKRKAEIKLNANQAILIGVPSKGALEVWKQMKEKTGGVIDDF